jgi:hypothetical protein
MLGFMITANPTDPVEKVKGLKELLFVMIFSDDVLQDDHEVACKKKMQYNNYLREHVKKVHFILD